MEKAITQIKQLLHSILSQEEEIFLVDTIQKGKGNVTKLIVLLDGDNGVPIEKCVEISRKISRFIDEEIVMDQQLTLEVSSAGLDHPIVLIRQYIKNIGREVKVTLKNQEIISGTLDAVSDKAITLTVIADKKKKTTSVEVVDFEVIDKTIVLVSFK